MNDDELYELMRREMDHAPIGDGNDLRRGRARLRRRRLFTGGSGVAGLALAATLVGGYLPASESGGDSAAVSSPDSSRQDLQQMADRTGRAVAKALEAHTRIEEFGQGDPIHANVGAMPNDDGIEELTGVDWYQEWRESGGVGLLQVIVSREFDQVQVPAQWNKSCAERFGSWLGSGAWPDKYDSCRHRTVDGQPLLVGVERRDDALWILVKYLRSDGVVVELGFDSPDLKSDAPVVDPSLTTDQLVDVVTDPRVRMYLDDN